MEGNSNKSGTTPYIIGITGGSGSGKTTFINSIRKNFTADEVCIISLDNYYKPRDKQKTDERGVKNFDLPESIDREAFIRDIGKLISGEVLNVREYTFNNELKEPLDIEIRPAPIIVIEGLFIFHFEEVGELMNLKIYLNAKENLKVIRRILRDREERNYPLDDVLYRYQHHVLPTYEKYIRPHKDESDMIINNNAHFNNALEVVTGFIKFRLSAVDSLKLQGNDEA